MYCEELVRIWRRKQSGLLICGWGWGFDDFGLGTSFRDEMSQIDEKNVWGRTAYDKRQVTFAIDNTSVNDTVKPSFQSHELVLRARN